ncbi:hypothetical protein [Spirillospora sp. CA-294931]|uniref:hypothetical protein n=1 Tax=Spirillospora sp. CA-294931 TaxID=3240042 RepID=UPI003D93DA9A
MIAFLLSNVTAMAVTIIGYGVAYMLVGPVLGFIAGAGDMDCSSIQDLQRVVMRLAVEVVRAAYAEALLKHELPPSTVGLIHIYADENIAALDETSGDPLDGLLDVAHDLMNERYDAFGHSPPHRPLRTGGVPRVSHNIP